MEIHILDMIQNLRTPIGDVVVPLITRLGDAGIIWIILTVLLLIIPKTRKTGVIMMAALLADVLLCNVFIKNLVARTRPFDVNTAVQLLVAKPRDYSFPSGHTAASFASVTALYLAGEKKMWKAALVLAVLIAFQDCTCMCIIQRTSLVVWYSEAFPDIWAIRLWNGYRRKR